MKKIDWNILFLAGLAVLAVLASLFSPTLIAITAVCFIGILGFWAWSKWLEFRDKQEIRDAVTPLSQLLESQKQEIAGLQSRLAEAEIRLKTLPEPPPLEKRLFDLAEKLRTRTTVKDGATTTDEVPAEIRDFITKNFPKS